MTIVVADHVPPAAGTTSPMVASSRHRAVAVWLFACCILVFVMVIVGGVTRLTHFFGSPLPIRVQVGPTIVREVTR